MTQNDKEAIIVENDLIKSHKPKFNIKLVDDKSHLCLRLDTRQTYPRLEAVRKIGKDPALYFGPYDSASTLRKTLQIINKHFQLRTCSDHVLKTRKKPCLQYQIKRCPAPCVFDLSHGEYKDSVENVRKFLSGNFEELQSELTEQMLQFSEELRFEDAARLRDQLRSIEQVLQRQDVAHRENLSWDILGLAHREEHAVICLIQMRRGRIRKAHPQRLDHEGLPAEQIMTEFIAQYYGSATDIPNDILLPFTIEWREPLESLITERCGHQVRLSAPKRGDKRRQVELANQNAEENLYQAMVESSEELGPKSVALMKRLRLQRKLNTIECFDISHFQGTHIVGSCVRFENDRPAKDFYRHYKVESIDDQDDYQALFEVLSRRARRGIEEGDLPDLFVIDGGKGQLAAAHAALRDHGIEDRALISLAKARSKTDGRTSERVFRVHSKAPISLKRGTKEFMLLTAIRDEAHRFAIQFQRKLRENEQTRSVLEDIEGVGPATVKKLLQAFGSVTGVLNAKEADLQAVIGASLTKKIMTSSLLRG